FPGCDATKSRKPAYAGESMFRPIPGTRRAFHCAVARYAGSRRKWVFGLPGLRGLALGYSLSAAARAGRSGPLFG
ncbi:MAG TPA: hypothetical protein VLU47_18425, partial [Blastocatellia bacterium]|nr:hypothetical protein [Blastocatellia bacterium]